MKSGGHHKKGVILALLSAALWGLTPVATKSALEGFTPEFIGFSRLIAAAVLFRFFASPNARWFVADPWIWLAGAGLGADFLFYNYGVQRTEANVAGLVVNIELLSTIALAIWLLGERLNARRVIGGLITISGVLLVTLDGLNVSDVARTDRLIGNVLVMAAGVSWSFFAVAQRRAAYRGPLFDLLTPIFLIAALVTAPAMFRHGAWRIKGGAMPVVMFAVLAVFGTAVVYWIYGRAQELVDMTVLSILLCTIPVFAVIFAYAILHEPLTVQLIFGGGVTIGGIVLIATEKARSTHVEALAK